MLLHSGWRGGIEQSVLSSRPLRRPGAWHEHRDGRPANKVVELRAKHRWCRTRRGVNATVRRGSERKSSSGASSQAFRSARVPAMWSYASSPANGKPCIAGFQLSLLAPGGFDCIPVYIMRRWMGWENLDLRRLGIRSPIGGSPCRPSERRPRANDPLARWPSSPVGFAAG